jgi:hypothetical protein
MIVAALIGLLVGGGIIWLKKKGAVREDSDAVTLNI